MGARAVADAVVELGDVARAAGQLADELAKAPEAAALLGDGDGQQRLAFLAHLGALCDEAQAVEVHVGAAQDGGVGLALGLVLRYVLLDGGHGQRACGLDDAARVHEDVLDRGAHGVGVDGDVVVHQPLGDAEGFFAHELDGGAVGEQAYVLQRHARAGLHGLDHGVGVAHLHADHLDLGAHGLDVIGHAADQPATADGDEHRVEPLAAQALQLAQYLHGNGALACDHVRIVKGMHESEPLLLLQLQRVLVGIGEALAGQHHLAAQRLHGVDLDLRGGRGHHDHGAHAELARAHGHALCVVAGRGADHALLQLLGCQLRHLVIGAAQLEAEHRLLVLAFEQHLVVQAPAQCARRLQVGLDGHVVHARREDFLQVVER